MSCGAVVPLLVLSACGGPNEQELVSKAQAALEKGDKASAVIVLKGALAKAPDSGQLRFLMGRALLQSGNVAGAEIEFRKALELHYPDEQAVPFLARCLLIQRRYDQIIGDYGSRKLSSAASQADLAAVVANAYIATKQVGKARSLVDAAIADAPGNAAIRQVQASMLGSSGDIDGALGIVERVLSSSPNEGSAWRLRGDLLLYGKRDGQHALEAYRRAIAIQPDDLAARAAVISILLSDKSLDAAKQELATVLQLAPNRPETAYMAAKVALASGQFERARELLTPLMRMGNEDASLLLLAAAAELKLNSLLKAQAYLEKILTTNPDTAEARRMLATIFLRRGEFTKALDILSPLINARSPNTQDLTLAAEAYLQVGDAKDAAAFFSRIVELDPRDVRARTALAMARLSKGETTAGLADLKAIAASDSGVLADIALINARSMQRDFDGALAAIDNLEKKLPDKPLPADLRGRAYLLKSDVAKARQSFEQAVRRDATYFPSVIALARFDIADDRPDLAEARLEALLKADPKNGRALVTLAGMRKARHAGREAVAQLLVRAVEAQPQDAATRVMLINLWLEGGNARRALELAQAGIVALPDSPELLDALGRAQLANGDTKLALSSFGKLAAAQPKSPLAQMLLASVYRADNNVDGEERALRSALELAPDLMQAQEQLIGFAVRTKRPDVVIRSARAIQQRYPRNAAGYLFEGDARAAFRDWDAAIKAYRAGLQLPNSGMAAVRLYSALVAANRKQEAEKFAADWLREKPKYILLRMQLADEALKAGEFDKAELRYREIVSIAPQNQAATNNLAWLLARAKKPGAAVLAERAVTLGPRNPRALDTLGFALAAEGQFGRAIEAAKSAVRLAPDSPQFRLNLAKIYLQASDKPNAKVELDKLAQLGTRFAGQREVAELLKGL